VLFISQLCENIFTRTCKSWKCNAWIFTPTRKGCFYFRIFTTLLEVCWCWFSNPHFIRTIISSSKLLTSELWLDFSYILLFLRHWIVCMPPHDQFTWETAAAIRSALASLPGPFREALARPTVAAHQTEYAALKLVCAIILRSCLKATLTLKAVRTKACPWT